jgi:homospermidine synthase
MSNDIWLDLKDKKILQFGFGAVGSAMFPLYLRHFKFQDKHIKILDMNKDVLPNSNEKNGILFENIKVTKDNYISILESFLRPGDMLVDLAWYIATADLIKWCYQNNVKYINAAVETWPYDIKKQTGDPRKYTLYSRQLNIQKEIKDWNENGPTCVLTHAANPGWVSHIVKFAMEDWLNFLIKNYPYKQKFNKMRKLLDEKNWNKLAKELSIQVIHVTEKDFNRSKIIKEKDEFVCTWSVDGFIEEGLAPSELGWGTHEKANKGLFKYKVGPKNQICLESRGINTLVESFVPTGNYVGMAIRHEESFSISNYLTVKNGNKVTYRPTVHYCYHPSMDCLASIYELQSNGYADPPKKRVMREDVIEGRNELGCFIMSRNYGCWWIGSILTHEETKELLYPFSSTIIPVAAGMISGIVYAFNHPNEGVIHPENMDEAESMKYILPYLGTFKSFHVPDWQPKIEGGYATTKPRTKDWVFEKLLVSPKSSVM